MNTPNINLNHLMQFSIRGFREVRKIAAEATHDRFVGVPVTGDSLRHIGIFSGDILITRLTEDFRENALCVWETPKGRTAKYAEFIFDEIRLHNNGDWENIFPRAEVKCLGIVVRVERDLEVPK